MVKGLGTQSLYAVNKMQWLLVVSLQLAVAPLLTCVGIASLPRGLCIQGSQLRPFCPSDVQCYSVKK